MKEELGGKRPFPVGAAAPGERFAFSGSLCYL